MLVKRNKFKEYQTINLSIPKQINLQHVHDLLIKKFDELDRIPVVLKSNRKRIIGVVFNFELKTNEINIDYCVNVDCRELKKLGMLVKKNQSQIKRIICFYME